MHRRGFQVAAGIVLGLACLASAEGSAEVSGDVSGAAADSIAVIPQPQHVELRPGEFRLAADAKIIVDPGASDASDVAQQLVDRLNAAGLHLALAPAGGGAPPAGAITFSMQGADASLGDEGYLLLVTSRGVSIKAPHSAGLFYGMQTLLQLLPPAAFAPRPGASVDWTIPAVQITDQPRFRWRGLLLDVSRHFEPKEEILRYLDQMAMHKLNVFHWHLTDDQGWRIEIRKYPKLTQIGAWRDSAGFGLDPKLSTTYGPDGRYGGFYTQDDVREVVAYAARLHISILPEIEMPGHASAARRAYPEYFVPAPPPEPGQVKGDAGIFNGVYDPANDQTFTFVQDILSEVMDLFPSPYIHIGGDEVPKGPWNGNPPDIAFMKEKHLTPDQLQSYFVSRIGKFIESRGKRMIGWDEILEGGLAPDATVMSWRGTEGGLAAARADHDVVMTPSPYVYLDKEQGTGTEPHERGSVLTAQTAYAYEPVPQGLPANLQHHVLGLQGNLWTEYVPNMPWAQYMTWPREAALAEVGWTAVAEKHWDDFARRLVVEQQRLDQMGVNYRPIEDDQLTSAIHLDPADASQLAIDNPFPGSTIRYTLDATYPTTDSPTYTGAVKLPGGWVQAAARYFQPGKIATAAAAGKFLDGRPVKVTSTMPRDWDARQTCFFTPVWGGGADDTITVTFDAGPQMLQSLTVRSGNDAAKDTKLKDGVLEISGNGKDFSQVAVFGPDGVAHADVGGKSIVAFRIRIRALQMPHPIIQSVEVK
jgi:hexosaminidase